MRTLQIEWRHLDVDGETCDRCYDTGENLKNEIKRLNRKVEPQGVHIELMEAILDESQMSLSNAVLLDGIPIEAILNIQISENYCQSCSDLVGKASFCRTVIYEGNEYEDIPAKAIRHAVYRVIDNSLKNSDDANAPTEACCCGESSKGCCG